MIYSDLRKVIKITQRFNHSSQKIWVSINITDIYEDRSRRPNYKPWLQERSIFDNRKLVCTLKSGTKIEFL